MLFSCNSSSSSVNPRYRTYSSNIIRVKTLQNLNETENTVKSIRIKKSQEKDGNENPGNKNSTGIKLTLPDLKLSQVKMLVLQENK